MSRAACLATRRAVIANGSPPAGDHLSLSQLGVRSLASDLTGCTLLPTDVTRLSILTGFRYPIAADERHGVGGSGLAAFRKASRERSLSATVGARSRHRTAMRWPGEDCQSVVHAYFVATLNTSQIATSSGTTLYEGADAAGKPAKGKRWRQATLTQGMS